LEGRRTYRSLLWKVPEGDRSGRKVREGIGSIKKYLATTVGRRLDIVPSKTFLTNLTLDPKPLYLLI
jgi:hypothetical protein